MGHLRRFLMLERSRDPAAPEPPRPVRLSGRFDKVESTGAPNEEAAPTTPPNPRFAPAPDPAVVLDADLADEERPACRCPECGTENGRFAPTCGGCRADLRAPAVVRFNRRLWQDERPAVLAERAARKAANQAEIDGMAVERRALAVARAEAEFERLVAQDQGRGSSPPIQRLAKRIGIGPLARWSPAARAGLVSAALGLPIVGLMFVAGHGARATQLGLVIALVVLWAPSGRARL